MGTQGDGDGTPAASGPDTKKDDIYENRPGSKKIIRVVTVMAYMVSVSFVAIVLSAYYVFLWQPPNPRLMHRSHLIGDPKLDYLMDRPPTEVTLDERDDEIDIRNKLNIFREEIIKNRGINVSKNFQPEVTINKNISHDNLTNFNNEKENNLRIIETTLIPIVRALFSTTKISKTEETNENSTSVYDSISTNVSAETIEASTLFTTTREINKSIGTPSSSFSYSSTLMEDTLYKDEPNKFTTAIPISVRDIEKRKLKIFTDKGIEESIQRSKDLLGSFRNKHFGMHSIGKEETNSRITTSGTSRIFTIKPEIVRMKEKSVEKPEIIRMIEKSVEKPEMLRMIEKSVEKPEMIRMIEKSVEKPEMLRMIEKSVEKPEMLRMIEKSAEKPEMLRMIEKSAEKPEIVRMKEKSVEKPEMIRMTEKSAKKPEMIRTIEKSAEKPEIVRMKEKSVEKPEMIRMTEKSAKKPEMIRTIEKSAEKPEMLRMIEKSAKKPEMLRMTEKSAAKPEMIRITEKSAAKPEMLRIIEKSVEKSEMIRTTEKSADQQEDWKPLKITVQPIELASHTARESAKFPTNETENLEIFSSSQQLNDEVSIEIVPDSPGDEDPIIKSSISMIPSIIQPESEYLEQEQQSKEQSTQDSDFGFV